MIVDPAGKITKLEHDSQDRISHVIRADGREQLFTYNVAGALKQFVDFDGTQIEYESSPVNLPTQLKSTPSGVASPTPSINLEYDGLRRITKAVSGSVIQTFQYDSLSRLVQESGIDTIRFTYDNSGLQRTIIYPDGRRDRFDLDELGRPKSVTLEQDGSLGISNHGLSLGNPFIKYKWAGQSRLDSAELGAGIVSKYEFDGGARLVC